MRKPSWALRARFMGTLGGVFSLGMIAVACQPARARLAVSEAGAAAGPQPSSVPPKTAPDAGSTPYVMVIGTAQDAGVPQIGCTGRHCTAARRGARQRRWSSSLMLCEPASGRRWLFDASPDIREQLQFVRHHPPSRRSQGRRPPLVEGIFVTHAHIGHYAGLMFLGRESYGAKNVPVFGTRRVREFLTSNGPWSQLVALGNIRLKALEAKQEHVLGPDLSVRALAVPHRDEFSDTVAYILKGPSRSLLYLPDIDKWGRWQTSIEEVLRSVDVALLDGTFFDGDEIPERAMAEIPHPFIQESLERFKRLPLSERRKIIFTHLNHSNPVQDPTSQAARAVQKQGMQVAERGLRIDL